MTPGVTQPTIHLFAASQSPTLRGLRQVKEYVRYTNLLRRRGKQNLPRIELEPTGSLSEAIKLGYTEPHTSIILAIGFPTDEIRAALFETPKVVSLHILSQPPVGGESFHIPTSSLLEKRTITRVRSLSEGVRKSVLQLASRHLGELREIIEPAELESYFMLRYHVWNKMGYLPQDSGLHNVGWEIDKFDRFSLPIGFISQDKDLVACARLVQQYGRESVEHVRNINDLLNHHGTEECIQAFSYRGAIEQPFDILWEFRGFREYFRSFVNNRLSMAEVSRLIVSPDYRGRGLAEILVDSLVSLATVQKIDVLLLACREGLRPLYERCGFVPVKDLVSDKFLTIPERSIVMERMLNR